jgi:hypothetical protein
MTVFLTASGSFSKPFTAAWAAAYALAVLVARSFWKSLTEAEMGFAGSGPCDQE